MRVARTASLLAATALLVFAVAANSQPSGQRHHNSPATRVRLATGQSASLSGIHRIRHVVVIMQENRSFDQYFGTFRGADGIPGLAGHRGRVPCDPDPLNGGCRRPFHDRSNTNYGGPHWGANAIRDMNCTRPAEHVGCKMNDFIGQADQGHRCTSGNPSCSPCKRHSTRACTDVMAYHTGADIPNYWRYARDFVLQEHMFPSTVSWSLPQHLYMVSEWSAQCSNPFKPSLCSNARDHPTGWRHLLKGPPEGRPRYAWTDLTYLLHKYGVSWRYYIFKGIEPDCETNLNRTCKPVRQGPRTPGYFNPLPWFTDVVRDDQRRNIRSLNGFFKAAKTGALPAVSWIIPNRHVSEHPGMSSVSAGQTYVTGLVNTIMQSPDWNSTAIFICWDDWGGFYDNAVPPVVDRNGYGLRVPGIVISPYAKRGYIDRQTLSFDAYNKFIEDDFLSEHRLNPRTDGRPDPRLGTREKKPGLGTLVHDFNFNQKPRAPLILSVCPVTDLKPKPRC